MASHDEISHFDERAATWDDDPAKVAQSGEVAAGVLAAVPVDRTTRLLEYGAGTGLVSQALADRVGPLTLADSSPGMRRALAAKVASGVLPGDTRVWDLDLETQPPPDDRFDLVVASMVLHHLRQLDRVLVGFARLLGPGGHVAVADLDGQHRRGHGDVHDFHGPGFHGHDGFYRAQLTGLLEAAGFTDVRVADCGSVEKEGAAYPVILAVAGRPAD